MRLVAALVVLLVLAPAARADVTFTGVPASPTNTVTFDVAFTAPDAVRYDCVHVFPDGGTSPLPGCSSPFAFRDVADGRHELQVTAFNADGEPTQGSVAIVVDTVAPPTPVIASPPEGAQLTQSSVTISGTADAAAVAVYDGDSKLGDAVLEGDTWSLDATNLAQGAHTVTAVASDAAGNTATSAERHFSVNTELPKPTIDTPTANFVASGLITLGGSTAPGTTVTVYEGPNVLGTATAMGATWAFEPEELSEGPHKFTAVATDTANHSSPRSDARLITVDTTAPAIAFGDVPASPTSDFTFDIAFSANEPVVFDCVHVFPDGSTSEQLDCDSPFELLGDGTHALEVTATDRAGNTRTDSVSVTIDTQAPAAVDPHQTGESEFTFSGEAGATFECSLDGAALAPCSSPQRWVGLAVGEHRFAVVAIDAAGNRSPVTTRAFTIAPVVETVVPVATVQPTPVPTAVASTPTAELGRTLVARTVSGKVLVRRPAAAAALDLGTVAGIPVGTEIDARGGRVRLTAATKGVSQRAELYGGVFVVTQGADAVVDVRLSQPFGSCAKKTGTRVRKLWGDGKGRFRMRGLYATVTVRGTRWFVQDSCAGTLTRVSQGLVSVRDTVKRKTVLVRAGRKYLAVPKKRH